METKTERDGEGHRAMAEDRAIRVLLIDDDEEDYLLTRELFDDFQDGRRYDLDWVATYEEGLQSLLGGEYDLCLLDYRLGARDGLELLQQALDGDCGTPIVMLTGLGDKDVDRSAMRQGAADYLVKGEITATLLERSIRHSLERHRFLNKQRQLASENARLYEEASRALEMRDEIYRIVVHDLRNPLSTMGLALQLMERHVSRGADADDFAPQLETQRLCIGQMNQLIQDLLDVTRLEAGQLTMDRGLYTPESIVESAVAQHQMQADEHSISLTGHSADGLSRVDGDARRIEQVLANLVSNAIKFTSTGGQIEVSAQPHESGICFAVSDTGRGIPKDQLPHLFDRFWQADDSDSQGAGLGLAICKGIVEAHGGQIWVESDFGEGTTFYFTIPTEE